MMNKKKIKVAIAMSGGIDSCVAAKLLVDQGYEVVGFMMKFWSDPTFNESRDHSPTCDISRENSCCDTSSLQSAERVAAKLGIPFYLLDVRTKFKKEVADYFVNEYKSLRTPNPCVKCNERIKFGWLLDFAEKTGCDYLATGHYARIVDDSGNPKLKIRNPKQKPVNFHLLRGKDETKDQSYFLYRLNQAQLSKIIFPLGDYTKDQVKKLAKEWKLPVFQRRESQEICFVKDKDYRDFLKRCVSKTYFKPGNIVDMKGNVVGKHDGLVNYTIGQRKRIEQNSKQIQNSGDKSPLYVVGYNVKKNRLIVGEDKEVYRDEMIVKDLSWINPSSKYEAVSMKDLKAKIRYRHEAIACKASKIQDLEYRIQFKKSQRAITPGQSAVFYKEKEVLGGGIIQ